MKKLFIVFLMMTQFIYSQTFYSPNKEVKLGFSLSEKGEIFYNLSLNSKQVLKDSKLGFELDEQRNLLDAFQVENIKQKEIFEKWSPVWGEVDTIINHCTDVQINLSNHKSNIKLVLHFRIFDDGLGFRYEFPKQDNLKYFIVKEERTQFVLTENHIAFWIPGDYDSQEYTYTTSRISEINSIKGRNFQDIITKSIPGENFVQTPLMLKTDDRLYINIHEAALIDYPAMQLKVDKENFILESQLCPDAVGNKAYLQTPFKTPWRTIIVSNQAEKILESKIILDLNDPPKFENASWIKPKKYIGIWWGMHVGVYSWNYADIDNIRIDQVDWKSLTPNGRHGATTENTKRYIDFAAKHGFDAVLIEGWNIGWEDWFGHWKENVFDFVTPYPDFDIEEISRYAKEKNVELIMHHETSSSVTNYERRMPEAFEFLKKYGYTSIKTGYVGPIIPRGEHHDGQWMVNHYIRVLEKAAREKICIDSHESVRLTGLHRTYPNWLAAEAARGNEFNAWSEGNPPEHETILPFTRLIGGPMDYTPGIFQIKMNYYHPVSKFQVHTTLTKQLALYVVFYSPLQMAADLIENYERFLDAFQFIKDVPVDWSDTKVLKAEPGDYIITVRKDKHSDDWYLGAITDELKRSFKIKLDFLENGNYEAQIYRDSENSHWEKNPLSYKIEKIKVNKNSTLNLNLVEGGGCAIRFKKLNDK